MKLLTLIRTGENDETVVNYETYENDKTDVIEDDEKNDEVGKNYENSETSWG